MTLVTNLTTAMTAIGVAVKAAKDRTNHIGTQLASTISDFTEASQDAVGGSVDTTLTYNDAGNSLGRSAITGDVTVAAGSNASAVSAGVITNTHVNASAAIDLSKLAPITGFVSGAGTVVATDTVLAAIQKIDGNSLRLNETRITATATPQAIATTAATNVTGLTFNTVAGKNYIVKVYCAYSAAAVGTGIGLSYSITGTSNVYAKYTVQTSAAGATSTVHRINSTTVFQSTASPATTGNLTIAEFRIETTVAGAFQFRVNSETNGSAITIQNTSLMSVQEIGT